MSYIKLCDVGKIYVGESGIAVGIRGVNLSFDIGEFVAITGQSGSGKSTLLNIISGMDTYEEGEMYIEGEPTSHFVQQDYEEYRKKYISFIFQDYNIIESFTVLQNVELALMHIDDPKARRKKALELLERVGLTPFLRHKGSHLSGGQKQRTVIARALAKDSPVILADEPTGNLDSKTSEEIIELLHEVSKDKLVIVVTHNFEEVEKYATRHVRIYDGAVELDSVITPVDHAPEKEAAVSESPKKDSKKKHKLRKTLKNGMLLGRVRFRAMPKLSTFLCLLLVFTCLAVTLVTALYGVALEIFEPYYLFTHVDGRVILMRDDGEILTESELEKLSSEYGAVDYHQCDFLLDLNEMYYAGEMAYSTEQVGKPTMGRYPETAGEVLLYLPVSEISNYGLGTFAIDSMTLFETAEYDIVGIKYYYDNTKDPMIIMTEEGYDIATGLAIANYLAPLDLQVTLTDPDKPINSAAFYYSGNIFPSFALESNEIYVQDGSFTNALKKIDGNASVSMKATFNSTIPATSGTVFEGDYNDRKIVTDSKECREQILSSFQDKGIAVNAADLASMAKEIFAEKAYNQSSLIFKNDRAAEKAAQKLDRAGYVAVPSTTETEPNAIEVILYIIVLLMYAFTWCVVIIFVTLFLILCTTRAMNATSGDIAILRTMGVPVRVIKISIYVQTFIAIFPAYIVTAVVAFFLYLIPFTNAAFTFLHFWQYAMIALSLVVIVALISHRYVKKIFGTTVKSTLKGGGLK